MSNYRVSKVKNNHHESIENKDFENLSEAEQYAKKTSLFDDNHFYGVEREIDVDEYEALKFYKNGQITTIF